MFLAMVAKVRMFLATVAEVHRQKGDRR